MKQVSRCQVSRFQSPPPHSIPIRKNPRKSPRNPYIQCSTHAMNPKSCVFSLDAYFCCLLCRPMRAYMCSTVTLYDYRMKVIIHTHPLRFITVPISIVYILYIPVQGIPIGISKFQPMAALIYAFLCIKLHFSVCMLLAVNGII